MEIIYVLLGFLAGFFVAYLIFKSRGAKQLNPQENKNLEIEIVKLQSENNQLNKLLGENKQINETISLENKQLSSSLASAETNLANLNERLQNQKKDIEDLQKQLVLQFENLANRILDEKSKSFKETNKQQLDTILNPLNENLKDFRNIVKDTYEKGLKERTEISSELKNLQKLNQQLQEEASNLAKALKGDSQKQGRWGEMILEKILESSGLEKGLQYKLQDSFTLESGKRLRPDAIVYLPDEKHIIIDSKVSLVAFEKYVNAENEDERQKFIKAHILSVRNHIKELASKDYVANLGIESPEYLLMFIPVEASFSVAVTYDKTLFNEAWDNRIVIVSPSTLIATLMTISSIWKQTKQTQNALEIAERGGKLYDKFVGFVEDIEKIGASINKAGEEYDNALKKLSTGSGNLIRQTEILKKLGAKTTKSLPNDLIELSSVDEIDELSESADGSN